MERFHITCVFVNCKESNLMFTIISWEGLCQDETHTIVFFGVKCCQFLVWNKCVKFSRIIYKVPQIGAIELHFAKTRDEMKSLDENNTLKKGKKTPKYFFHWN
jgi:hypothetical protein